MNNLKITNEINKNLEKSAEIKEYFLNLKDSNNSPLGESQIDKVIIDLEKLDAILNFSKKIKDIEMYEKDIREYTNYIKKLERFLLI